MIVKMLALLSIFVILILKSLNLYSKTLKDFLSAPETFKFEDRDWVLELGWEQYD